MKPRLLPLGLCLSFSLVLLVGRVAAAAESNPLPLAERKDWAKLEAALQNQQIAVATSAQRESVSKALQLACFAKQFGIVEGLAALGGSGRARCLSYNQRWDELLVLLSGLADGAFDDKLAGKEELSLVIRGAALSAREDILLQLQRVWPKSCRASVEQAASANLPNTVSALLQRCPTLPTDAPDLLTRACALDGGDKVKALSAAGWPITGQDRLQQSCLLLAARRGQTDIVGFALQRGAEVDTKNRSGLTVMEAAVLSSNPQVVKLLLESARQGAKRELDGGAALVVQLLAAPLFRLERDLLSDQVKLEPALAPSNEGARERLIEMATAFFGGKHGVLVLDADKNEAEARRLRDDWAKMATSFAVNYRVAEGFPRLVKSELVSGAAPGGPTFFVVLATGLQVELEALLPGVATMAPRAMVMSSEWAPETGVASLVPARGFTRVEAHVVPQLDGRELRATMVWDENRYSMLSVLHDANGRYVTHANTSDTLGLQCKAAPQFKKTAAGLVLEADCDTPGCTQPDLSHFTVAVSVGKKGIEVQQKSKIIKRGECD